MIDFFQHVINGLSLGSIYALIALGYTMVYGVLRLINFAHSEVYMVGAFIGFYSARMLGLGDHSSLSGLIGVLLLAMIGCALLGFVIERFAYRPLRGSSSINSLITAVGVSLFLQFTGQLVFGAEPKFFPQIYQPEAQWSIGELNINVLQVVVALIAIVLMAALQYVIFGTRLGRAMRAVSFSPETARLMGIPTDLVISATFMLGSALAGAAGVLVGLIYPKIDPLMGAMPGLKAFVAAVVGGIGNVVGAVIGALTLGLAEEFIVAYGRSTFRDALAFLLLILILLFRPSGLLGSNTREKV
jgi:branched-chain amino acid transport system permease protein